ncbi:MAG: hypothetical protein HGA23_01320, partial [Bacteroidales bacterium]|nr:hypothetical protein [Bacteroidales bacterium]
MVLLKRRLDVRSEGGTLIQVGVFGKRPEEPEEAMDIANAIAEELRAFRIEQHESPAEMLEMTLRFTPPYILLGLAAGFVPGLLAGGLVLLRGFLRRGSQASQVKTAVETIAITPRAGDAVLRQIQVAALGLLAAGILKFLGVISNYLFAPQLTLAKSATNSLVLLWLSDLLSALVLPALTIFGALKMKRRESYAWGLVAALVTLVPSIRPFLSLYYAPAGIVSPFNFLLPALCLALGLWALIVLSRKETRAAFAGDTSTLAAVPQTPAGPRPVWSWIVVAVGIVLLLPVLLIGGFLLARESAGARAARLAGEHAERILEQARSAAGAGQFCARLPQ